MDMYEKLTKMIETDLKSVLGVSFEIDEICDNHIMINLDSKNLNNVDYRNVIEIMENYINPMRNHYHYYAYLIENKDPNEDTWEISIENFKWRDFEE